MRLNNTTSSQNAILTEAEDFASKLDSSDMTCEEAPEYVDELQSSITDLVGLVEELDDEITDKDGKITELKEELDELRAETDHLHT